MSTADRRLDVLRAIVIEYVNTKEPVASKAVATSHVTGVSSATIRNDMGILEEEGLIRQPHTSAGRIPTEAGYRLFVDVLDPSRALRPHERQVIEHDLLSADNVEDAITRTVRILAGITGQAAVAEYPDLVTSVVRRIEIIDLDSRRILVIVVTTAGRIYEHQVTLADQIAESLTPEMWWQIRRIVNEAAEGVSTTAIGEALALVATQAALLDPLGSVVNIVREAVEESLRPLDASRIITAGAANLARSGVDFQDVAQVLEVLEDQATLLRIFQEIHTAPVQVSIGAENQHEALAGAALVSATYSASCPLPTHVGVIGPTRMDYARSLAAVEAVSNYLSRLLLKQSGHIPDAPQRDQKAEEKAE